MHPQAAIDFPAHRASADLTGLVGFQRLLSRGFELFAVLNDRQPERRDAVEDVAGSSSVALDDWLRAELLQARSGRDEVLVRVAVSVGGLHVVTVADPRFFPSLRAVGNLHALTVQRNETSRGLTHRAPRNEFLELPRWNRSHRHRHRFAGRQPNTIVVVLRVAANVVQVAEHERHRREASQARTRLAQVLTDSAAAADGGQKRVAVPQKIRVDGTAGNRDCLRMACEDESATLGRRRWWSWVTGRTRLTSESVCKRKIEIFIKKS